MSVNHTNEPIWYILPQLHQGPILLRERELCYTNVPLFHLPCNLTPYKFVANSSQTKLSKPDYRVKSSKRITSGMHTTSGLLMLDEREV